LFDVFYKFQTDTEAYQIKKLKKRLLDKYERDSLAALKAYHQACDIEFQLECIEMEEAHQIEKTYKLLEIYKMPLMMLLK
jgi:hypothetical protein